MGTWINNDGLYIAYGTTEAVATKVGETAAPHDGEQHVLIVNLDLTDVQASPTVLSNHAFLPDGAFIDKVRVKILEVADGDSAVLNVGLIKKDAAAGVDQTTELDYDGLIDAEAETDLDAAVGTEIEYTVADSGDAGALVGTELAETGWLCADYDTAAFTAGEVRIYIFYHMASA